MATLGLEAGIHVFFALLAMLASAALLALLYKRVEDVKLIRTMAIAIAVLIWLSWFTVIHVYTIGYAPDRTVIKSFPETAPAHSFGMETKEHIFYTGLFVATLLPIVAYSIDIRSVTGRKLMIWLIIIIIVGGLMMEGLGAWIASAAKQAWSMKAGG